MEILYKTQTHKQSKPSPEVFLAEEVKLIASTSNVYKCQIDGKCKYVRLMKKHCNFKDYVRNAIKEYFDIVLENHESVLGLALADANDNVNMEIIKNVDKVFVENKAAIRNNTFCDYETAGFPSLRDQGCDLWFSDFVTFLRAEIFIYNICKDLKKNELQLTTANLQIASKVLAELLGCGRLIPNVELCKVMINKQEYDCTIMDESEGICPAYLELTDRKEFTKQFLTDLCDLEVLDAICYQPDHKMKNYHVIKDDLGRIDRISAFDNDCALTFFPFVRLLKKVNSNPDYASIVIKGKYNRKFVNSDMIKRINEVRYSDLKSKLIPFLTVPQIICIYYRMCVIKKAISKGTNTDGTLIKDIKIIDEQDISMFTTATDENRLSDYFSYYLYANEKQYFSAEYL